METTRDALFEGALVLEQPARGYRLNVDAVILAAFAASLTKSAAKRACDLGAGVGAVGLSLLHLGAASHVTLVESDDIAVALAGANARENGFFSRAEPIASDVLAFARTPRARGTFDLVVTNPPYVETGAGRAPRDPRRAKATMGSLATFVRAARLLVRARGRVCLCYPAQDLASALATLRAAGLEAKRARFVHAAHDRPARIVLLMAQPGKPGGLSIDPPLVERDASGIGQELRALFRKRRSGV